MPRKESEEARIAHYFSTAQLDKAETIFEVAKGILKRRRKEATEAVEKSPDPPSQS